ncbi:unnamed protein product [Rotaria sp. Silwood2]|nr:unnamed protein product [Rotaria sp. Silwood2]CAF4473729.1 unnamed protein product [Rotaria sp. Silwood2]
MHQYKINLLDLPTEVLHIILKKLDSMDVLYSLFAINNQRLDNIIQENTFTNTLNFVLITATDDILSVCDRVLDRFCLNLLPKIHNNVKSLILNSLSMEHILLAGDYPNLSELKIFNFNIKIALHYFTELCDLPLTTCYSSNLCKLSIRVLYYHDLLALLDGRLKQLNTLNVVIVQQEYNPTNVYNVNLSHLKCFSLQYDCSYDAYDGEILPLLQRMSNIEVLNLNLIIGSPARFIDGKNIYDEILIHMPRLHTFNFCFLIFSQLNHSAQYLYKDDILQTFTNIIVKQVECMIKYRRYNGLKYLLFSLPFMFDNLQCIGNGFSNIIFNHVIRLVVDDDIPFEHEFFMRVACCFPLLKVLTISNSMPQSPILNSYDNQLHSTTIEYPYLTSLCFSLAHCDYVEQFLNDKKTHLPRLTVLSVNYYHLRNVTKNFTNDRTRLNCMKVKELHIGRKKIVYSKDFHTYFPLL